jgi:cysteinyl-tRNA synthetase
MTTRLRLQNTLSGRIEELVPADGKCVKMYVCGPTVYSRAHIGNFRTFVSTDILRRTLKFLGHEVLEVMNITDVDDRIIQLAAAKGTDIQEFTEAPTKAYLEDLATLRMERPEVMPKATEHVPEMVALIERLTERGHTYTIDGSIYFRIASFPSYGGLSRLDVSGIKAGCASTPTSTRRKTRATSSCGSSRATSPRGRSGTRRSARGARAGTSSARP